MDEIKVSKEAIESLLHSTEDLEVGLITLLTPLAVLMAVLRELLEDAG